MDDRTAVVAATGMSASGWVLSLKRRSVDFWAWKRKRRKMTTRVSRRTPLAAPERSEKYPEPTAQEWRETYEWDREINQRIADGTIDEIPPIEEQLADHIARLGLSDHFK